MCGPARAVASTALLAFLGRGLDFLEVNLSDLD